jgi:hypothetical protein
MSQAKCPYANILGIPGTGFHSTRVFGIALYDTLATILVAYLTTFFVSITFIESFIAWFVVGELLHWIAGVDTAFLKMIHASPSCI